MRVQDVHDLVHTNQLEQGAHRLGRTADLEITPLRADLAQAGKQCAETGTVEEGHSAQVEDHLRVPGRERLDLLLELLDVARVEYLASHPDDTDVADLSYPFQHIFVLRSTLPALDEVSTASSVIRDERSRAVDKLFDDVQAESALRMVLNGRRLDHRRPKGLPFVEQQD